MLSKTTDQQWLVIDGIRIRYDRKGKVNASPLVLLHGLGGSLETFQANIDFFAQEYDVIAIDFPGFGYSDKPATRYTIHFQVLKLKRLLDQLQLDNIYLAGHSMGGAIAIHFAHLFASRVKKLILICNAGMDKQIHYLLRLSAIPLSPLIFDLGHVSGISQMLKNCVYNSDIITSELIHLYQDIFEQHNSVHAYFSQLKSFVTIYGQEKSFLISTREKLPQLIMPTLIIWGNNDRILPVSHAKIAHDNIHNSECIFFDNCGHIPQLEKPEQFNTCVHQFLGATSNNNFSKIMAEGEY
jgi:4,5:9,10-diseco-3-hydroxy-5,9,17-trioxoandrosta-1(10),2-diene-4-oate hydrolase